MDDVDLRLYHLLMRDLGMPYRELSERLGISLQAVHKRLRDLSDSGAIAGFSAAISGRYLNTTDVFIFGHMDEARPLKEALRQLSQDDRVGFIMLCSSNVIYVSGTMRLPTDMDDFHASVRKACGMRDSTLAIESLRKLGDVAPSQPLPEDVKLSLLDLRIVASLKEDARKPFVQVGKETGVTARTARQRLERMLEEGSVDLIVRARPIRSGDVNSVLHVRTREGVDRSALGVELVQRHPNDILFFRSYCNLPDLISMGTDHHSICDLKALLDELLEDERVLSAVPNIIIDAWEYPTWKDKMLPRLLNGPGDKVKKE